MTTLVRSPADSGAPMDAGIEGNSVDILDADVVAGCLVATIKVAVLGAAPGTPLQTLYAVVRSTAEHPATTHWTEPSPIVNPEMLLLMHKSERSDMNEQSAPT